MLKHATISRTSRAQQTLQLQRHWQHQDQQQQQPKQLGCNQESGQDGSTTTTTLDGKTNTSEQQQQEVHQVDLFNCIQNQASASQVNNIMDIDVPPPQTTDHNESIASHQSTSLLSPSPLSSQRFLQPNISSSCCSSPTPSSQITTNGMQFTAATLRGYSHMNNNTNYHSPAKSRSTPPSLANSPMKLIGTSRHRSSSRSARFSTIAGASTTTTTSTLTKSSNHNNLSSLSQQDSMIKIFAQTLSQDVEYITLHVNTQTKSQQIIKTLLRKFRLKHRDPNLFHLTLERWIRKDGLKFKSVMLLGDEACPLQLQQCCSNPPHNDIKFTLQMRSGALVKIYCSDVVPDAKYKCLSLSTQTTVEETIELMLYCLNLASQSTAKSRSTSTTTSMDNHHHRQFSDSPSSASSSSSDTSSSSGIESEPSNNINTNSSQTKTKHGQLDSDSRASSVTSISSGSNVSSLSSSLIDQYCMVIECKDSNFKRVLHSNEYLVDVYQGLIAEASKTLLGVDSVNGASSLTNHNNISSSLLSPASPTITNQSPDQWFFIKLKRRYEVSENSNNNANHPAATINYVNPRQNMPLPPIPPSLLKHHQQQQANNNLRHIVSTAQIELNRPGSSMAATASSGSTESELMRDIMRSTPIALTDHPTPQHLSKAAASRDEINFSTPQDDQAPPPIILLTPPVRPRRRNLSTASSTFGRPLIANNRRRYDPAQLAEDLDKLNIASVGGINSAAAAVASSE